MQYHKKQWKEHQQTTWLAFWGKCLSSVSTEHVLQLKYVWTHSSEMDRCVVEENKQVSFCLFVACVFSPSVNMLADVGYIPEELWIGISQIRSCSSSDSEWSVKACGVNSPTEIKPLRHLPETNGSEGGRRGFCRDVFCSLPLRQLVLAARAQTPRLLLLFNFRSKVTPNGCCENGKLWSDSLPKSVRCVTMGGRWWIFITGRLLPKKVDDLCVYVFLYLRRLNLSFKAMFFKSTDDSFYTHKYTCRSNMHNHNISSLNPAGFLERKMTLYATLHVILNLYSHCSIWIELNEMPYVLY